MKIGVVMGSASDWGVMSGATAILEEFGVEYEKRVLSAHRTPAAAADFARSARANGFGVLICAAGMAAHLAGVFACNFANHLFELGGEVLRRAGVPADLLRPLIAETTAKALDAARPAAVQTGPAVRGDLPTQERHLGLLAGDDRLCELYRLITQSIWETSKKIS